MNPSWVGRWQSGETTLIVTPKNVINFGKICRWVDKAPTQFEGCIAHYATNSAKFKIGDEIIYLSAKGKNTFEGEQVYQNGKFNPISATLLPDGRLQFKGEKNISWTMTRQ
jgi:hypothetical protein